MVGGSEVEWLGQVMCNVPRTHLVSTVAAFALCASRRMCQPSFQVVALPLIVRESNVLPRSLLCEDLEILWNPETIL